MFYIANWGCNLITFPLLRPSNLLHTAEHRTIAILFLPVFSEFFSKSITCIETWLNRLIWEVTVKVNEFNQFYIVIVRISLLLTFLGNLWFLLSSTARSWWIYREFSFKTVLILHDYFWHCKYWNVHIFQLFALGLKDLLPDLIIIQWILLWAGLNECIDSF